VFSAQSQTADMTKIDDPIIQDVYAACLNNIEGLGLPSGPADASLREGCSCLAEKAKADTEIVSDYQKLAGKSAIQSKALATAKLIEVDQACFQFKTPNDPLSACMSAVDMTIVGGGDSVSGIEIMSLESLGRGCICLSEKAAGNAGLEEEIVRLSAMTSWQRKAASSAELASLDKQCFFPE